MNETGNFYINIKNFTTMYQQIVRNEDGEPLYIENVRDPYEEEIFGKTKQL